LKYGLEGKKDNYIIIKRLLFKKKVFLLNNEWYLSVLSEFKDKSQDQV
jgi:hypothetical protein